MTELCAHLELDFDDVEGALYASISATDEAVPLSLQGLTDRLVREGHGQLQLRPNILPELLRRVESGEWGRFVIARRVDAGFALLIAPDGMSVQARVSPPYGGKRLSVQEFEQGFIEEGLSWELCDRAALPVLIRTNEELTREIARGQPSLDGTDSYFEPLVQGVVHHAPTDAAAGNVDQFDIEDFVVVAPGTPLMRRHAATEGRDGMDVFGRVLSAKPGKHTPFARELGGAARAEDDTHLLVAAVKGHPVVLPNGVRVDQMLKFPVIDRRCGNVDFDGSIQVAGDVTAGVRVHVTGDVLIKGMVEHAHIEAGGNIIVAGGIVNPEFMHDGPMPDGVRLEAGGNIEARFVSGAQLRADGDIRVKEYIAHSSARAQHRLLVGQSGGKGRIYGGQCHGGHLVMANHVGSNASVDTTVSAGLMQLPMDMRASLRSELQDLSVQQDKLHALLHELSCEPIGPASLAANQTCVKIYNTLAMVEQQQAHIRSRLELIQAEVDIAAAASIRIGQRVRANVTLQINGVRRRFSARASGGQFVVHDDKLVRVG